MPNLISQDNNPLDPIVDRQISRWYNLKPIPEQIRLIESNARFNLICAGRRSGKTERAKRRLIKQALTVPGPYFVAAPTIPQVRNIYWDDLKKMALPALQKSEPLETKLVIPFDNGSTIQLLGMEKPKRFEGALWMGGLLDEFSYFKEEAWSQSIYPALDTESPERPGYKAWCWILSKPNGLNHFYRMFNYAKESGDPAWAAFHWKSAEVLSPEAIEAAKRNMSAKDFRQEYEASFETVSGRIYEDYSKQNYTDTTIQEHEEIRYFCDFNYTPMSHGIGVIRGKDVFVLDEIILESATAQMAAQEFVERYKDHKNKKLYLYGDPSGKNGEKHGLQSEYINMERVFKNAGWIVDRRVRNAHPAIVDRQNAVRAKILNALGGISFYINPSKAPWSHEGMATVQVKEGSSFIEDQKNKYQHITTAIGYFIDYEFPIRDAIMSIDVAMFEPTEFIKNPCTSFYY